MNDEWSFAGTHRVRLLTSTYRPILNVETAEYAATVF